MHATGEGISVFRGVQAYRPDLSGESGIDGFLSPSDPKS